MCGFPSQEKIFRVAEFLLYATEKDFNKHAVKTARELAVYFRSLLNDTSSSDISNVASNVGQANRNSMISNIVNSIFEAEGYCKSNDMFVPTNE
jgi:hypothetical protein